MFLSNYLHYASGNEAPRMFHVWGAYFALSAAFSRRGWMALDDSFLYPNIYVMLVGGAGNGKSWALAKPQRMLAELNLPYSGDVETPEGIMRFMTGDPAAKKDSRASKPYGGAPFVLNVMKPSGIVGPAYPMNIIASEFIDFIRTAQENWLNTLNNIFDREIYLYRTKGQGQDLIEGPHFTMLAGLTTQVAHSLQKDQIINTGFARRTIFQYGERQWHKPMPRPVLTQSQRDSYRYCIDWLKKVQQVSGEFAWPKEVGEFYDEWYKSNSLKVTSHSPQLQSWYGTKSAQVMKFAMLTSLSERLDRVLEVKHLQRVLYYMAIMEKDLFRIFGGSGQNPLADVSLKIYNYLRVQPEPVEYRVLKVKFFKEMPQKRKLDEELQDCLAYLCGEGLVLARNNSSNEITYSTPTELEPRLIGGVPAGLPLEVLREWLPESDLLADPSAKPASALNPNPIVDLTGTPLSSETEVDLPPTDLPD